MSKGQSKSTKSQNNRAVLPPKNRRSSGISSIPAIPKDSPLWGEDSDPKTKQTSSSKGIQIISPIYFKNHRGEVLEQARDGAVFVVKRRNEHMAIICGYSAETLAMLTDGDEQDTELDDDPMRQRVSIAEILEFVKQRKR